MLDPAFAISRALQNSRPDKLARMMHEGLGKSSLTVLLPCYLPNEHPILMQTINHIIHKLEYGYPFCLIVCYNTPKPMDFEQVLLRLDGTVYPNGRSIKVVRVVESHSKAQNLNAALERVETDYVALYDADHHPDPLSLLIAMAHMMAHDVHCVQGSTYLRHKPSLLSKVIDAEFFVIFFCFFPAVQV